MSRKLSEIHRRMIEVLKLHPEGLTAGQWRKELHLEPDEQSQLDRRKRDLYKAYEIQKVRFGKSIVYVYKGELTGQPTDSGVSLKIRAQLIHEACGRCSMCGRIVKEHNTEFVIDHKIPKDWGGTSDPSNLWAICKECNGGKKNYFASYDQGLMRSVMHYKSVHMRVGELLKAKLGEPVPSFLIAFVAAQDDWKKRTRELRYLGWRITVSKKKAANGKVESFYSLHGHTPWPPNPSGWIQQYERERKNKNSRDA